jgi:hypothetical protein
MTVIVAWPFATGRIRAGMGGSPIGVLLLGMGDRRALVSDAPAGRLLTVIDTLRDAIAALDGVVESPSMFKDDLAYWVHGKEIAHFETRDLIEIRLTRSVIRERRDVLRADPRIEIRYSGSDWIDVRFSSPVDIDFVLDLVEAAAAAHLPPPGVAPDPPPTGPDLERRRRFH